MFDAFGADVLAALLFVVAILNFRRIGTFLNLSKVHLRSTNWEPVPRSEVPPYIAPLMACAETALKGIGFEFCGTLAVEPLNILDPRKRVYTELHWHPELCVLAAVGLAEAHSGQATKVQFTSAFTDGTLLVTMNREQFAQLPLPADIILEDIYADDLTSQWQAHCTALAREKELRTPITERSEAIQRFARFGPMCCVSRLVELGWVVEEAAGQFRLTPRGAWCYSGQITKLLPATRKALARPYRHNPVHPVKAVRRAEMDSLAARVAQSAHPYPAWMKAFLFTFTLALSAVLFGRGFGLLSAAALLVVLLIHEFGHLAAMWIFSYRNLSVFFLPMLGAAAVGHKPNAPPVQEALVLLAGPLFGLLLAFGVTQIPSDSVPPVALDFLRAFFWFGVVLNLFNLLPFGILDGGRLFELAVLGRYPAARAAFATFGAVLGLGYAAWSGSLVFGLAMLILLTSTPTQFRAARVISAVRSRARTFGVNALSGEQAIATLGHEFAEGGYGGDDAAGRMQRLNIAELAYPRLLQGVPGLGMAAGAVLALAAALTVPLAVLVWSWVQPEPAPLMRLTAEERLSMDTSDAERAHRRDALPAHSEYVARYTALTNVEAKWAMLDDYQADSDLVIDPTHEEWKRNQRVQLLDQLPPTHPAKIWQRLHQTPPNDPAVQETLIAVLTQLTDGETLSPEVLDDEYFALFLHVVGRLGEEAPALVSEKRLASLDALWATLNTAGHPHAERRAPLVVLRAHLALELGQGDEADKWMKHYVVLNERNSEIASMTYAWFLIDAGRAEQALLLAKRKSVQQQAADWNAVAGWAELGLGHYEDADVWFQAAAVESAAREKAAIEGLSWWARLMAQGVQSWEGGARKSINAGVLDRLAAMQGYDPAEAARLAAELSKSSASPDGKKTKAPFTVGVHEGWGKLRAAQHRKLLSELGFDPR